MKEVGSALIALGVLQVLQLFDLGSNAKKLLAAPTAPYWAIAVGILVGLVWTVQSARQKADAPQAAPTPQTAEADSDLRYVLQRTNEELAIARRARESAERSMEAGQRDLRTLLEKLNESEKSRAWLKDAAEKQSLATEHFKSEAEAVKVELRDVNARWNRIAPFVDAARRVERMSLRLAEFMDRVSANMPNDLTPSETLTEIWVVGTEKNKREYEAALQPDLVRLAADLKASFGLVRPGLSDESLTPTLVLENTIQPMIDALVDVRDDLMVRLAREATKE